MAAGRLEWPAAADPDDPRTWPPTLIAERDAALTMALWPHRALPADPELAARWRERSRRAPRGP